MKILLKKRRRIATVFSVLLLLLCACGQKTQVEPEHNWKAEAEAASACCVSKEDCFLCGASAENFGQDNVGIVSLNNFAFMPVEINRYDRSNGNLIEVNTGAVQMRSFHNGDSGLNATLMLDPDRGIANVSISPNGDATLNLESAAAHLCPDCLAELASQLHGNTSGIGVINFNTCRLYVLQDSVIGFGAGNYYVHCDQDLQDEQLKVLITYSPLRYEDHA